MKALLVTALLAAPLIDGHRGRAFADTPNATTDARAKVLFDEGKTLFAEGQYGKACEKLDASFKLSRLSSTRGLLAACYEKIGKLASAWVAYRDAAAIAKAQGNVDRAQAATEKADELFPKLAKLGLDIATVKSATGLEVKIDGIVQPPGSFDRPLPIDGGPHVVTVDAVGWKEWRATVDIADGEQQTLKVPPLVAEPSELEVGRPGGHGKLSRRKLVGLGLGIGGVAAVGVGLAFGVSAKLEWDSSGCESNGDCPDVVAQGKANSAARSANIASVVGASGLVLVGVGAIVFFTGGKRESATTLTPTASPGTVGLALGGRF